MSKKALFALMFLLVLVLGGVTAIAGAAVATKPVDPANQETQRFVISRGQGSSIIGANLAAAGLIRHPLVFRAVIWQEGLAGKIQAGSFELSPSMSTKEIAYTLTEGTEDVWVTFLEGWRVEEIADAVKEKNLPEFDAEEFVMLAKPQEGYLFPDTYLIPRETTAEQLLALLTNTFTQKVEEGLAAEIEDSGKSLDELVVMASLVQREAKIERDMRHVAGILWNRIDLGMPLQVDATLQYITTKEAENGIWWPEPSAADKQVSSPYNTYQNQGLTPGPISNPGVQAIKAAAQPLETEDIFYLHDRQGVMHYATTLDEHNRNIQQYLR